ncbi:MAG: precorrin-2 C(20)-methyltransferase [Coxiella sp. RIFCSPHIGHO2_12_FULL_44_14]|nr:MAG: precorrin-2 C(20)-methyltransferase [Coxiella sp. RIFCSPHIGHO2_12_FULL_44_14]
MKIQGNIYGVGLGPGASDLMSVRSDKLVRNAKYIAYFRKRRKDGHARTIVEGILRDDVVEIPMVYPVTTEIAFSDPKYNELLSDFYIKCTDHLYELVNSGEDVVVLCEGDPFFYGSFMHLYTRLMDKVHVSVVPGITGMSGAWTASGVPITWGDDILTVLMATLSQEILERHISQTDALVIMKIGRNLEKVRVALEAAGKLDNAWLVKYASMENQQLIPVRDVGAEVPYFSIVLVHGNGRRP